MQEDFVIEINFKKLFCFLRGRLLQSECTLWGLLGREGKGVPSPLWGEDSPLLWQRQVWRFLKWTWLDLYRGQSDSQELKCLISMWKMGLVFLIGRVIKVQIYCSLLPAGIELHPSWYVLYKDKTTVWIIWSDKTKNSKFVLPIGDAY